MRALVPSVKMPSPCHVVQPDLKGAIIAARPWAPSRGGGIWGVDTWGGNLRNHLESWLSQDLSQSTRGWGTPTPQVTLSLHIGHLKGPLPGVLLCCSVHQVLK